MQRQTWFYGLRALLLVLVAVGAATLDPFGAISTLDRESQRIFWRLTAPYFEPEETPRTLVILLDDQTLEDWEETWPIDRGRLAGFMGQLQSYGPEAVFVDLYFDTDRGAREKTEALARFATPRPGADGSAPFIATADLGWGTAQRYRLGEAVPTLPVHRESEDYTLCFGPGGTDDARAAAGAAGHHTSALCPDARPVPAPALALFERYCSEADLAGQTRCARFTPRHGAHAMAVRWPWEPAARQHRECPSTLTQTRMVAAMTLFLRGFLSGDGLDRGNQPCAPIETYSASSLAALGAGMAEFVRGRYVFIGSSAQAAPDLAPTPVHGQLPGVYEHAAAFLNLTEYGPAFYKAEVAGFFGLEIDEILEIVFMTVLIGGATVFQARYGDANSPFGPGARFSTAAVLALIPIVLALALSEGFHLAPVNWLGLSIVGIGFAWDLVNEDLNEGAASLLGANRDDRPARAHTVPPQTGEPQ